MADRYFNIKSVKVLSLWMDISFLVIHILMLLLFKFHGVTPMFRFNIFSVAFYCLMPLLLIINRHELFVRLIVYEVLAHMTAVSYYVGWRSDFQISLIGFAIFPAYAELMARRVHHSKFRCLDMCVLTMLFYLAGCVINYRHTPPYALPEEAAFHLRVGWGLSVFVISIIYLQLFVSMLDQSRDLLEVEALHDSLTGLHNRYYMADILDGVMDRPDATRYWVAIADLDGFKQVNDVYGHNCGDYVLKALAELLQNNGFGAEVCRWGGEEFLLMGQMYAGMDDVLIRLNRLRRRVSAYNFLYEGQLLDLTITIGVAAYQPGETTDAWVNRADMKLYEGKTGGKNRVVA